MVNYTERYTAFIDILGFSDLVKHAELDDDLLKKLYECLDDAKQYQLISDHYNSHTENLVKDFFSDMFMVSAFSDSIFFSAKKNPIGLGIILEQVSMLCNFLLLRGIFTRGAISVGKLIHKNSVVLGEGLIRAYKLENSTAIYPRIIIDKEVIDDMNALDHGKERILNFKRLDFDGLWHLHILQKYLIEFSLAFHSKPLSVEYSNFALAINTEIDKTLNNQKDMSIYSKIMWFISYYNNSADSLGFEKIER